MDINVYMGLKDLLTNTLIKYYVPQKFNLNGVEFSIKEVLKQIKGSERDIYVIIGRAGAGKTTAVRYLYYKLVKMHKCVYFQMISVKTIDDIKRNLNEQKLSNNIKDGDRVFAFFDGIDEAISLLKSENIYSLFLKGLQSKVNQIFSDYNLILQGIVLSLRSELLENAVKDLAYQQGSASLRVYDIIQMSNHDVITVFKSLKKLKKMYKKEPDQRHKMRFPEKGSEKKYIKRLYEILEKDSDSIFHYPLFIRYAYVFMKEYNVLWLFL